MVAIVLLPGMDGTGEMFAEFAAVLKEHMRPIVVSYPENRPVGYPELESYARDFLPRNEPFLILGESFSGPIAISLAASKPAGLLGLILCCTFARNPLPLLGPITAVISRLPMTSRLTSLISPLLFGSYSTSEQRRALRQALDRVPMRTLQARIRAVLGVDYSEKMKHIEVPILYLQAANDRIVPPSATRHAQALASQMHVVRLNAPHLLLQVAPAEAGRIVETFSTMTMTNSNSTMNPKLAEVPHQKYQ